MNNDNNTQNIRRITICIFVLLLLLFSLSDVGQRAVSGLVRPFADLRNLCSNTVLGLWKRVFKSNDHISPAEYESRIINLQMHIAEADSLRAQNEELRQILQLTPPANWTSVPAELVMRDPATWNWQFRISRGKNANIKAGNPVLFGENLIGRVTTVFTNSAIVATLASPECRFGAFVQDSKGENFPGVFQGGGGIFGGDPPDCSVDFLPKEAIFQVGGIVVTSGLGTAMPAGIPVGSIMPSPNGDCSEMVDDARLKVTIQPFADFKYFTYVTVFVNLSEDVMDFDNNVNVNQ